MTNTPPNSNTEKTVQQLSAGWRNYVCDAMGLDRNTFQLAQGGLGLQTADSSGLFLMADAVPASSTVGYYDASSMNKRSSGYLALLGALLPETNPNGLQTALGDGYASWITWKTTNPPQAGDTILTYFQRFELQSSLDPGRLSRGEAAITASQNAPLNRAWSAFNNPANQQSFVDGSGKSYTLPSYAATIANAQAQINQGRSVSLNFNSNSMDTSASSLFVEGSVSGFYDIFSGGAGASFDQQNSKAAGSGFTVTGTINKVAVLPSSPGAWYSSDEVGRAFNNKGNAQIWDPNASAGDWNNFFGQPNGELARYVSQLVLVSDYTIKITSEATYTQDDFQQIKTHANVGVWPFFSASASSTQTTSYALNSASNLEVTQTLGKGLIQIWGVSIQQAP